jgi:hypothetical protein
VVVDTKAMPVADVVERVLVAVAERRA